MEVPKLKYVDLFYPTNSQKLKTLTSEGYIATVGQMFIIYTNVSDFE